jgi:hypothetical protein
MNGILLINIKAVSINYKFILDIESSFKAYQSTLKL